MCSTALLDTGVQRVHWHVICATSFFFLASGAVVYNTFISTVIYLKTKGFSKTNLTIKYIIAISVIIWVLLALFYKTSSKTFGNVL
jgi:uncharacterized membrane protein